MHSSRKICTPPNTYFSQELELRCEVCGHDRVRTERSLAQLPGALIVHLKRFDPVINPSAAQAETDVGSVAANTVAPKSLLLGASGTSRSSSSSASREACGATSVRSTKGSSSRDGGSSGGSAARSGSGFGSRVSYEKLTTPICVPKELDLKRFCTDETANAPTGDLGEVRGEVGTPRLHVLSLV